MGSHVQQYLVGLDADWQERPTRWTLGVQTALEEGIALHLFPVEVAASPRRTGPVSESNRMTRGELEGERAAPGVTESHQNTRSRDTTLVQQPGPLGRDPRPRRQHPG